MNRVLVAAQPGIKVPGVQDHRHAGVDMGNALLWRSGDHGVGQQFISGGGCPGRP